MAGVAINGSEIAEVTKPDHVTYKIETWNDPWCAAYDEESGLCIDPRDGYWSDDGTGSTGAKITGYVSAPSSKMKLQGNNVAKVGDITIETWVADPPIPSSTSTRRYTATSDTSGSGQGSITSGSSKGRLDGKSIALTGSEVTTHLGVKTTISAGNTNMNFSS